MEANVGSPIYQNALPGLSLLGNDTGVPPIAKGDNCRSHFIAAFAAAAAGGPVAYVDVWLTAESEAPTWRERAQAARQFGLFEEEHDEMDCR